jgi:hypothetical protein
MRPAMIALEPVSFVIHLTGSFSGFELALKNTSGHSTPIWTAATPPQRSRPFWIRRDFPGRLQGWIAAQLGDGLKVKLQGFFQKMTGIFARLNCQRYENSVIDRLTLFGLVLKRH